MSDPSDEEVDYLLGRGSLSGPQRDQILQNVLASSAVRKAPARRRWLWGGTGLALAAGAAAVILWPRVPERAADFRTKGSPAATAVVDASCLGATVDACPRGSLLAFGVEGAASGVGGFISAYADPIGAGERIWYLTNEPVTASMISKAAKIGAEHTTDRYDVHMVVTRRVLSREALLAPAANEVVTQARFALRVVP